MAAEDPLAERLVDALGEIYGVHPGHRAAHARGVLCGASFTAAPEAGTVSRAAHLAGGPVRAHVRFSNGTGDPSKPDGTRDGRGMAVKFYLPDATTTDIVSISLPLFFSRTPEDFLAFNVARRPDPETGVPDMARLGPFLDAHPETANAIGLALALAPPESYLTTEYHAIHAFRFLGPARAVRHGRYHWRPLAGVSTLEDADASARPADYLTRDLADRLAGGPGAFALELELAEEDDPLDDPTAPWPPDRTRVTLGRLEIDALAFDREQGGDVLVFDPNRLADGIEATADPILAIRSPAYSVSVARRAA